MRILKIEIEAFGKLRSLCLEPAEGITLIEGENESGKSTLLAFLRFVFYGFPRRSGAEGEERDKRLTWQGRSAKGSLTLSSDGQIYRLTRRAYLRGLAAREVLSEELSVLRMPEGERVELGGKTPGEYFLGLSAELYEGSLCMTQSGADRVCAPGVGEAVGELLFAGETAFSAEDAQARLQQARRDLRHLKGRGGRIAELEDELSALDHALAEAKENRVRLSALRAESARCRADAQGCRGQIADIEAALERADIDRTLALFDDHAAAKAEEERCRLLLEKARAEQGEGTVDPEAAADVALTLRHVLNSRAQQAALSREADDLAAVRHDQQLVAGAARIREAGGAAAVLKSVAGKHRKRRKCAITGMVLALLALVAGCVAWLLPQLALYLGGVGAAVLLLSLCFLGKALSLHSDLKKLLISLCVPKTVMLRTHLEQCLHERTLFLAHQARAAEVQAKLSEAQEVSRAADAALRGALARIGKETLCNDPDAITAYLEQLARHGQGQQSALSEATIALARAQSVTQTLSHRLSGIDEAALRARRDALPAAEESVDCLRQQQMLLRQTAEALERSCADAERAEAALAATARDPGALERERRRVAEALSVANRRLAAVRLALEAMDTAVETLRRSVTPALREETARLFAALTGGAHGELRLSADFSITLEEQGLPRPLSHFSAGCRDAAHLSLRLALLESLSAKRLPLFLDEALARLDDSRAKALLEALVKYCRMGGQCLLFTCHERESRLLAGESGVKRFLMPK